MPASHANREDERSHTANNSSRSPLRVLRDCLRSPVHPTMTALILNYSPN
ncbi:MAG: hypothetical protein HC780_15495 [Leptolyngbyaceae cyanobacterium CSU_1_3]|nr:hypothetical protein [Leptolyngbyaceae cyanobacterium CSU_1_3]